MPAGESFPLTKELVDMCRANGSFTNATLNALGLGKKDMIRGWTSRLVGTVIRRDKFLEAVEGKHHYRMKLSP